MRTLISSVVILAVGCISNEPEPELGETESAVHCPIPHECTLSNGGGVYTEEDGIVGIGERQFMITHFINEPSLGGVKLEGRYLDPVNGWLIGGGRVRGANYEQQHWNVLSITETETEPTWTLESDDGMIRKNVVGPQIINMGLIVFLEDRTGVDSYVLDFTNYLNETDRKTIYKSRMRWKKWGTTTWSPYCLREDGVNADPVVFQQGIIINALNARMWQDDDYVTLSCRHGGPPTVRLWGYDYQGPNTDLFEAALHMKRASYCGDATFYTRHDTEILINDNHVPEIQNQPMSVPEIEASWGPDRARCVTLANRRRPHRNFDGAEFDGRCFDSNGNVTMVIPECTSASWTQGLGMIADRPRDYLP